MASVTVALTAFEDRVVFSLIQWPDNVNLGSTFDQNGEAQEFTRLQLWYAAGDAGQVNLSIVGPNNRFTVAFEATGRIIVTASDGETLEVMIADADMTEPYQWTPTNSAEVIAFATHVRTLTDRSATLTLTDDPPVVAPAFADPTGDAQIWTQNTAITPITVPEATGFPVPTYTTFGIPAGVSFNAATRVISGTPTGAGSGTLRVRATNSQGLADWTAPYTTAADIQDYTVNAGNATWAFVAPQPSRTHTTPFVPSGSTNYDNIVQLTGGDVYAIRFTASGNYADYFESSPAEGMLLNNIPAAMFTDASLYWIERFRGADGGNSLAADNGQFYTATRFEFHRGGSSQQQRDFLPALSDDYSWVVINETTEEYLMWPANGQSAGSGSSGGSFGGGFCVYVIIPTHITDTNSLNENNVKAIAQAFDGTNPLNSAGQFNDSLLNSEVIVALIPSRTYRPSFGTAHTVDAGDANFAFATPQPAVLHGQAANVNAGDAEFTFALPQPSITYTPVANQPPTVTITTQAMMVRGGQSVTILASASDQDGTVVSTLWAGGGTFVPQNSPGTVWTAPAGGAADAAYTLALTATDDDGDAGQAFVTMTVRAAIAHTVNPGDTAFAFTAPQPAITTTGATPPQEISLGNVATGGWNGGMLISPGFVSGGGVAYLRHIGWAGATGISINLALTADGAPTLAGPEFTDAVEENSQAFEFLSSNGNSIIVPGPTHSGSILSDPAEPYYWQPENNDAWLAWWSTNTGTAITLTIRDTDDIAHTVDAGDVSWLFAIPSPTVTKVTHHALDAGDASFVFAIPQPSITSGGTANVNAGDATFSFAIPEPDTTVARRVNAGGTAWAFAIPPPTVTNTSGHSVDAGDASFAFGTQFGIDNFNDIAALPGSHAIRFTSSGNHADYFESNPAEGMLLNAHPAGMFTDADLYWIERVRGAADGDELSNDGGVTYEATRIELHRGGSNQQQNVFVTGLPDAYSWIIINETTQEYLVWPANGQSAGSGSDGGNFGGGFIQYVIIPTFITDTGSLGNNTVKAIEESFATGEELDSGGNFNNALLSGQIVVALIPNSTFRPRYGRSLQTVKFRDAGDADFAFTTPEPTVTVARAADAGDASWAFTLPTPGVSVSGSTQANAGDVAFAFAVPEPTVTSARTAGDHAVNAGDVFFTLLTSGPAVTVVHFRDAGDANWAFALPQPGTGTTSTHLIDAGDASFAFALPEPDTDVTHFRDAGDATFAFAIPEPAIGLTSSGMADAGDVSWAFDVPLPAIGHLQAHRVDAGDAGFDFRVPPPRRTYFPKPPAFAPPEEPPPVLITSRLDPRSLAELLVEQYQRGPLRRLVDQKMDLVHQKLVVPLRMLEYDLDAGIGWQLDVIGTKLGISRPVIPDSTVSVFGFSGGNTNVVGFDQGYFRSVNTALGAYVGVSDSIYRRLLKMRARTLVSRYTIPELDAAVQEVVADAQYREHGPTTDMADPAPPEGTLKLYIGTGLSVLEKMIYLPHWPRPAAVGLTIEDTIALPF